MIELTRDGALWRLTINRPEKANSLTATMLADLIDAVSSADGGQHVLLLTGSGNVFSAGADLDEARSGLATSPLWQDLSDAIASLPCLTIAALNGTLAGGAFGMVLACDLRIAVDNATFFYPVMKLGFLPQPSDAARLRELIGPARAKMILLAGQRISATEALNWGLVDRVVPADGLQTAALDLADAALGANTDHLAAIKKMVR